MEQEYIFSQEEEENSSGISCSDSFKFFHKIAAALHSQFWYYNWSYL